jgi:hypothetical protein
MMKYFINIAGTISAWGDFYTGVLSGTVSYPDTDHTISATSPPRSKMNPHIIETPRRRLGIGNLYSAVHDLRRLK